MAIENNNGLKVKLSVYLSKQDSFPNRVGEMGHKRLDGCPY